ncbi:M23 family metallopeptidase [Streptomyces sp.]|uniref:M23 family metallopeptidase n=1 Tax=Streptomyces sp. TaxID=1931 RepID=UPI002F41FC9C
MNERPPSGTPDYDAYGYDAYSTGSYQTVGTAFSATAFSDDTTGSYAYVPQPPQYDHGQGQSYGYDSGHATGYDTGGHAAYDPYAFGGAPQATATTYYDTGTYDVGALWPGDGHQGSYPQQQDWDSGAYPAYGYGYGYDASGDTGVYEQVPPAAAYDLPAQRAAEPEPYADVRDPYAEGRGSYADAPEPYAEPSAPYADTPDSYAEGPDPYSDDEPVRHDYAGDGPSQDDGPVARSRRRKPAKRSALLTVAVPSVAVMGVAAVGAAAVTGVGMAQDSSKAQADGQENGGTGVKTNAPTTQLDRQLAGVSRDADDFATRASRTQARIDLKDRQAAAKKAKEEAAARKEALRPKFLLPVKDRGLSAYFGQAGVNWMALHTGIDFPVQTGTPVMAATDGTVRTLWNGSYGYMSIVTAPDGTETWYCHLSRTKVRSGSVKAGEVIAYSGNTGNTTGPHLHFEVRPDGGAPINPLPWLLSHGLDPR